MPRPTNNSPRSKDCADSPVEPPQALTARRLCARDALWLAPLCIEAVAWLIGGRAALARRSPNAIDRRNRELAKTARPFDRASDSQRLQVLRIAFVVPRIARLMPFRSDCLVQAIAAQEWLAAHGLASAITLGVARDRSEPFEAHAWLDCGPIRVTGGDSARYVSLPWPLP